MGPLPMIHWTSPCRVAGMVVSVRAYWNSGLLLMKLHFVQRPITGGQVVSALDCRRCPVRVQHLTSAERCIKATTTGQHADHQEVRGESQ